ncbi:acyltransferase [Chelatococcus sp. SYSU_G07232]|uniref:Acyltransferase n=1 Tax=Chelatococcus albus TaxID=3047466 RepID=A0ABT7AKV8_9HYPH|nr:acyltransferase [Chelatococcus sp. SYSU_G07232]MDJ1159236.1 acyltransferase [Chelatococcus sp. SYSU_G07232]
MHGARFLALDSYRFMAAMGIVLYHMNQEFEFGLEKVTLIADRLYMFVDFFFIISGFVIMTAYAERATTLRGYGDFLWRRLARIYPLHVVTALLFAAMGAAATHAGIVINHAEQYDLASLPWNLALLHAWGTVGGLTFNGPSWSISAEFFVYLLFPAIALVIGRWGASPSIAMALVLMAALALWRRAEGGHGLFELSYDFGNLRALPSFWLGAALARAYRSADPRLALPWAVPHAAFLAIVAAMHLGLPDAGVLALMALTIVTAPLAERTRPHDITTRPAMVALGGASYSLYMLHVLVLILVKHIGPTAGTGLVVKSVLTGLFIIALALACHRWFERPVRHWIRSLLSRPALQPG